MKVWVIQQGKYSDRRILGVCSTEARANVQAQAYDGDVEEWELDDLPEIPKGYSYWNVVMFRDGSLQGSADSCAASTIGESFNSYDELYYMPNTGKRMAFYIMARNAEHAVKIANEMRTRLIANNEWGITWVDWVAKYPGKMP